MKELEPVQSSNQQENPHTTTLVINDIPSELAYKIFVESLSQGETLSPEELSNAVNEKMGKDDEQQVNISYEEIKPLLAPIFPDVIERENFDYNIYAYNAYTLEQKLKDIMQYYTKEELIKMLETLPCHEIRENSENPRKLN